MTPSVLEELHALPQRYASRQSRDLPAGKPVWIFGTGQFGRDLCGALQKTGHPVAGFVETKPSAAQVLGLPVLGWQQWSPAHTAEPLCVGIFNRGMPLDQLEALARQSGAQDVYLPWDLYHSLKQQLDWRFWLSEPERILDQTDAIAAALDCMDDEVSQRCMLDIAAFRLGLKTAYGSFQHDENQYFNPLTLNDQQGKALRFVDGGAYNGDTYLELCSLADVQTAYLFEPDTANFAQLTKNVVQTGRAAQCLPLGLSDSYRILSFNAGSGEGAAISENGTAHIAVAALDDVLAGCTVDFIKLDVEGAELQALQGARKLIQRSRPVLALSLYHCPQDLWELPLALSSLCEDYRFHVRQHYFNSFDSVLYAVPRHR
ncbi:FkbM family methyltransferase [Rhodoferax sp. GW822-FHT02A01]|uniref:FkbM family methyltransferase n=1 Tax=Rhodoferax sp. GW822-FHT02A01 TaxID=3141537 RepID=UPI00315D77CD